MYATIWMVVLFGSSMIQKTLHSEEGLKSQDDKNIVHGRVLNEKGMPIRDALISPVGGRKVSGTQWHGRTVGVETSTSDQNGEFKMILPNDMNAVHVQTMAEGYCGSRVELLSTGSQLHEIIVPVGATVTGKLVRKEVPVVSMSIAVVQMDRSANRLFINSVRCKTTSDGAFEFKHLPPDQEYCIYSYVGDALDSDVSDIITTRRFSVPKSNESRDLGMLQVANPVSIRGTVESVDGNPIPDRFSLRFGRDPAWDSILVPVAADGSFEIKRLPPETYEIRLGSTAMRLDADRIQYQLLSEQSFGVRATSSIDRLIVPVRRKDNP